MLNNLLYFSLKIQKYFDLFQKEMRHISQT